LNSPLVVQELQIGGTRPARDAACAIISPIAAAPMTDDTPKNIPARHQSR
jgi:hypothetical protein